MSKSDEKKEYCDSVDQKKVVEKMVACDETSKDDKEKNECYTKVIKENDGCMSS